jgi:hypothetical protein
MRLLPGLTSVAPIIRMAASAHADSDHNDDHAFLATLTKAGITYRARTAL